MNNYKPSKISRRHFIAGASGAAAFSLLPVYQSYASDNISVRNIQTAEGNSITTQESVSTRYALDLAPANWIWFPAARVLPNTFFFFRKSIIVNKEIASAKGWILGDSRYVLQCNGHRVQFGPAPADPRFTEADPLDLSNILRKGENILGATVLFYGFGDGTWPIGKPGFIFKLDLEYKDGSREQIISDDSWDVKLADCWRPGMYKRWYLRSLQETFDSRLYPVGWSEPGFKADNTWQKATVIQGDADKTALHTSISDYMYDAGFPAFTQLRKRTIPLLSESQIPIKKLADSHWIKWNTSPEIYFDLNTPKAFEPTQGSAIKNVADHTWAATLEDDGKALVLTFEMEEHVVGWPYFTITAPEGTIVELLVQQAHIPFGKGGPALISNNFNAWTRFVCREGKNEFNTFDFESLRWFQLHIRNGGGSIIVANPGVLRRTFKFSETPLIRTSDEKLQKLFNASINTIANNSQETIVDCMGRERQQYSGDIGHVVHALHRVYNENRLPARYINTFSQGITMDGFFLDTWPAYDRLNRLSQRQLGLTPWGPLLDHSIGFNNDVYYHYMYSGNAEDLEEVFPRLVRFFHYLKGLQGTDGLLPVENIGIPAVWLDHDAYKKQRHKQCAFNLYAAGMLKNAFSKLCELFSNEELRQQALEFSRSLVEAVKTKYWSNQEGLLVNNLPWAKEEGELRTCELSLSHYILNHFAAEVEKSIIVKEMTELPARFGLNYPTNAQWRYWALAECGEIQPVIDEFRSKWYNLPSVQQNNAMQEMWNAQPDTTSQYSHAAIAPLYVAYMSMAGIKVLEPGGKKISIRPLPGDVDHFELNNFTPKGPVNISWKGKKGSRELTISLPSGVEAALLLDKREKVDLPLSINRTDVNIYKMEGGSTWKVRLKYT